MPTPALDAAILRYAHPNGYVLVTKDSDFIGLGGDRANPAIVWVRCSNLKLAVLRDWFAARSGDMLDLLAQGERVIELR